MHQLRLLFLLTACFAAGSACAESDGGGAARPRQQIAITLSDTGCSPNEVAVDEGPVRFYVTNPRSSTVTSLEVLEGRRTVAAVTNVLGGISRSQNAELSPGTYTLRCMAGSVGGTGVLTVRDLP